MKITILTIACVASLLTAVACTGNTTDQQPTAKTKSASTATSTPNDVEEEGAADKVTCSVDSDCDSDERCDTGKCVGLDGDRD
jgi:hypothetical protein